MLFPAWVATLDTMIEATTDSFQVKVMCDRCGTARLLDRAALEALRERVGGTYSLINRRCSCRLRRGCNGWNRFHYQSGVMRPLWDDVAVARWTGMYDQEAAPLKATAPWSRSVRYSNSSS